MTRGQDAVPAPFAFFAGQRLGGVLKRVAAVSAGVMLGMVIVAGAGAWRDRPKRLWSKPATPPTFQGEIAPGIRV